MGTPRRPEDDWMDCEKPRATEQSSRGGIISRMWHGSRGDEERSTASHSVPSGSRNTNQGSHSPTPINSHRVYSHRDPPAEKTTDRLRRERNIAEDERDALKKKVAQLEKEVEQRKAIVIDMKASTQRVLASTQEKELFIGPQTIDLDIQAKFIALFKAVRTWSRFLGGANTIDVASLDPGVREDFNFIAPGLDDMKLEKILGNSSKKKYLAQGWIGLMMTNHCFSTLPDGKYPGTTVHDLWVESEQAQSFRILEIALSNAAQKEPRLIAPRDFHDWRAYTAALVSRASPNAIPSADDYISKLVSHIISVLRSWSKGAAVYEEMGRDLMVIFKSAVDFSMLLRVQRVVWSVRYPNYNLVVKPAINTKSNTAKIPMQHIATFDPTTMKSLAPHEPDERTDNKFVEIVTSPALFKRGNTDGLRFDTISTIQPSAVLWAEIAIPRPLPPDMPAALAGPAPAPSFAGDLAGTKASNVDDSPFRNLVPDAVCTVHVPPLTQKGKTQATASGNGPLPPP